MSPVPAGSADLALDQVQGGMDTTSELVQMGDPGLVEREVSGFCDAYLGQAMLPPSLQQHMRMQLQHSMDDSPVAGSKVPLIKFPISFYLKNVMRVGLQAIVQSAESGQAGLLNKYLIDFTSTTCSRLEMQ